MARHVPTPLSSLYPAAEIVTLDGRDFLVDQFRVRDLAEIERLTRALVPNPLDELPPIYADDDPSTRRLRVRAALKLAMAWPPVYGSDESRALIASDAGAAAFVLVLINRRDRTFDASDALELVGRLAPEDWSSIGRLAFGREPWQDLEAEFLGDQGGDSDPEDWSVLIDAVSVRHGMSYEQVGDVYLSQFAAMCRGGKPKSGARRKHGSVAEAIAWRNAFLGLSPDGNPEANGSP